MRRKLVGSWCVALAVATLPAQVVVVDPNGGGQFTNLQAAIDAVAPGTVLRVLGGTHDALTIDKSLSILGDPGFAVVSLSTASGPQPPGILLAGSGSDRLVLSHVTIQASAQGWHTQAGAGIRGSGFATLQIHDSTIHGARWAMITGNAPGAPAIDVDAARLVLSRCDVRGSTSMPDQSNYPAPDGPTAVIAPNADVIAVRSTIEGGSALVSRWNWTPWGAPCPCPNMTGRGGDAVSAQRVFHAGTTLRGGAGSPVEYQSWSGGPWFWWGRQPDGAPVAAGSQEVPIELRAAAAGPMRLGQPFTLDHSGFGPLVLIVGIPAPAPYLVPGAHRLFKWGFVDLGNAVFLPIAPLSSSTTILIPGAPSLAGAELALQFAWAVLPSSLQVWNPVFTVVTF